MIVMLELYMYFQFILSTNSNAFLFLVKYIYFVCNRIINEVYILVYNDVPQPILNMVVYINDNNGVMDTK